MSDVLEDSKVVKITMGWAIAYSFMLVSATAGTVTVIDEFKTNDTAFNQHVSDNREMFSEHQKDMIHRLEDIDLKMDELSMRIETKQDKFALMK
jgi:hypothetical protein